jgi:hypothetical protein
MIEKRQRSELCPDGCVSCRWGKATGAIPLQQTPPGILVLTTYDTACGPGQLAQSDAGVPLRVEADGRIFVAVG